MYNRAHILKKDNEARTPLQRAAAMSNHAELVCLFINEFGEKEMKDISKGVRNNDNCNLM